MCDAVVARAVTRRPPRRTWARRRSRRARRRRGACARGRPRSCSFVSARCGRCRPTASAARRIVDRARRIPRAEGVRRRLGQDRDSSSSTCVCVSSRVATIGRPERAGADRSSAACWCRGCAATRARRRVEDTRDLLRRAAAPAKIHDAVSAGRPRLAPRRLDLIGLPAREHEARVGPRARARCASPRRADRAPDTPRTCPV